VGHQFAASPTAVTPGSGEATVTWQAPASEGESPIVSYRVTADPGGAGVTVAVEHATGVRLVRSSILRVAAADPVFSLVVVAVCAYQLWNLAYYDPGWGYDGSGHVELSKLYWQNKVIPFGVDAYGSSNPPR